MLPSSATLQTAMTDQVQTPRIRITQKSRELTKTLNLPSYMQQGYYYKPYWHLGQSYLYLYTGVSQIETLHAFPLSEIYGDGLTVTHSAGMTVNRGLYGHGPYYIHDNGTSLDLYMGRPSWNPSALGMTLGTGFGLSYALIYRNVSYDLSTITGGSPFAYNYNVAYGASSVALIGWQFTPMHSTLEDIRVHNDQVYVVENNSVYGPMRQVNRFQHEIKRVTGQSLTGLGITMNGYIQFRSSNADGFGNPYTGDQSQVFNKYNDYMTAVRLAGSSEGLFVYHNGVSSTVLDDIEGNVQYTSQLVRYRINSTDQLADRRELYSEAYDWQFVRDYDDTRIHPTFAGFGNNLSVMRPVQRTYTDEDLSELSLSTNDYRVEVFRGTKKKMLGLFSLPGNRRITAYHHEGSTSMITAWLDHSGGGLTMSITTFTGATPLEVISYTNGDNSIQQLTVSNAD